MKTLRNILSALTLVLIGELIFFVSFKNEFFYQVSIEDTEKSAISWIYFLLLCVCALFWLYKKTVFSLSEHSVLVKDRFRFVDNTWYFIPKGVLLKVVSLLACLASFALNLMVSFVGMTLINFYYSKTIPALMLIPVLAFAVNTLFGSLDFVFRRRIEVPLK